jgi:hypothetical protein
MIYKVSLDRRMAARISTPKQIALIDRVEAADIRQFDVVLPVLWDVALMSRPGDRDLSAFFMPIG